MHHHLSRNQAPDPDDALRQIRKCIALIDSDDPAEEIPAAHELAMAMEGLDAHLLKGGVLPVEWRRIPAAAATG